MNLGATVSTSHEDGVLDGEQRDRSQCQRRDNPGGPQTPRIGYPFPRLSTMAFTLCRQLLHTIHACRYSWKSLHHYCPL